MTSDDKAKVIVDSGFEFKNTYWSSFDILTVIGFKKELYHLVMSDRSTHYDSSCTPHWTCSATIQGDIELLDDVSRASADYVAPKATVKCDLVVVSLTEIEEIEYEPDCSAGMVSILGSNVDKTGDAHA